MVFCVFLGCFTLVVLMAAVFGDQGMLKIRYLARERTAMLDRVAALEEETTNLRHQVVGMQTDPFFYEKAARERLGLVKRGEVIYDFRADPLARVP
jgi:cell division protein FtsB